MNIRPYEPRDREALLKIHEVQNAKFGGLEFCDPESPNAAVTLVIEDEGRVVAAMVALMVPDMVAIFDPSWETPRNRLRAGMRVFAKLAGMFQRYGFEYVTAKTSISRYARRLVEQVGFVREDGVRFVFSLRKAR